MKAKYLPPKCGYEIEGNHIKTDGTEIHKVSGTSLGGILGVSPFTTPFQVACALLGLGREDISDKPAVKTGIALEGRIISYLDKAYGEQYGAFMPAEAVYEKREGDHDSWVSDFDSDIFAGHVDGVVFNDSGDYILEIKTTSNVASWENGVPEYYKLQISLYNHFISKKDRAYVGLGIVDEATHRNPNVWVPNENTVTMYEMPIDQEAFAKDLEIVREWYDRYIAKGITPDYDPANEGDAELFEHLKSLNSSIGDMRQAVKRYAEVSAEIDDAELAMKAKYDEKELLKARIKSWMESNDTTEIDASDAMSSVKLTVSPRVSWDEAQMIADKIDVDKYKKEKPIATLRLKYMEE